MSGPWCSLLGTQSLANSLAVRLAEYADRNEAAATAGALIVENAAKDNAPYKSGTLKRSIDHETIKKSADVAVVAIGTDLEYARLQEFGGTVEGKPFLVFEIDGETIFARSVTVPPHPYLRPALDENKDAIVAEVRRIMKGG